MLEETVEFAVTARYAVRGLLQRDLNPVNKITSASLGLEEEYIMNFIVRVYFHRENVSGIKGFEVMRCP